MQRPRDERTEIFFSPSEFSYSSLEIEREKGRLEEEGTNPNSMPESR
jgi:hypothetical protein